MNNPQSEQSEVKHNCANVSVQHDKEVAETTVTAEIPAERTALYREKAIAELEKSAKIDGFREGKVPRDVLIKHTGESAIMERTAHIALSEELPLLLAAEGIPAISTPSVSVTKIAQGNPLGFTAKVAVMPEVTLADYKKIAKEGTGKKELVVVTEEEVEETITHLRRERAKIEKIEAGTDPSKAAEEAAQMQTLELPGIDDPFVQSLGYKDADDFKIKLRENIKTEKENREREKVRIAIIDEIVAKSTIPVPGALVNHELDKMEAQMSGDLEQAGLTLEKYFEQIGKKREEMRGEWKETAKKRAQMQLALAEIAQKEDIKADKATLNTHVEHAKKHNKDINEANVRAYYEQALRNEAVLKYLENL